MAKKDHNVDHERAHRQFAYAVYRDQRKPRSLDLMVDLLREKLGDIPPRRVRVWCQQDHWIARVAEYDTVKAENATPIATDPNFDRVDKMLRAADLALTRALEAHPVAVTPQDMKSLVDTADKAIRCVEKLRELGTDKRGSAPERKNALTRVQRMFNYLDDLMEKKHAAEGHPIGELIVDAEFTEPVNEPVAAVSAPTEKPLEIMVERPSPEPVVSPVVETPKTHGQPLSVADRLAMRRQKTG